MIHNSITLSHFELSSQQRVLIKKIVLYLQVEQNCLSFCPKDRRYLHSIKTLWIFKTFIFSPFKKTVIHLRYGSLCTDEKYQRNADCVTGVLFHFRH